MMENKIKRIEELIDIIDKHNYNYYVLNEPKISDYDFDMLLKELESLEKETGYVKDYSPTQRVGSDTLNTFADVKRDVMMGSIENCYDREELYAWLKKYDSYGTFILEPKYDGTSCSIIYKNGVISVASTRGNGYVGSDITENVKTIKNVPLKLDIVGERKNDWHYDGIYIPDEIEIRGEILLPKSELKRINIEREKQGLPVFANERNAAAGSIKQQDSRVTASRNLIFKPYRVICNDREFTKKYLQSQHMALDVATIFGFSDVFYVRCVDAYTVQSMLTEFEDKFLNEQDYCMDGAVIKVDDRLAQNAIGSTNKTPRWAKAFKFKQEQASTKLNSITVQLGMSGQLGFVGELDPVEVDGSVISRVTLNNMDYIREMDIKIGSYVFVKKNGAVIPGIVGIDYERNVLEGVEPVEFEEPVVCPFCGGELTKISDEGAHLFCTNKECEERIVQKISYFVKKECMNIDGISEKTIRKMYKSINLRSWQDLMLSSASGAFHYVFGDGKSTENLNNSIRKSMENCYGDRVLCAFGIPMIGKITSQKVMERFKNFDNLVNASLDDILSVEGIGTVAGTKLYEYIRENTQEFEDAKDWFKCYVEDKPVAEWAPLSGMTILATGTLENFKRDEIKASVIENGGKYASGVSGKLTFMIVGSDAGKSKIDKATALGVKMITEAEYMKMIS